MKLKKSVKRFLLIILILIIVLLAIYYLLFYNNKQTKKVKVLNSISEYGYQLNDNKSKEYKELFSSLKKILKNENVDEEEYVKTIAKMFIFDYYSLDDKMSKTDIGGSDFVHKDALVDFLEKSQDTMYKYVETNLYGERKQNLPTVKEVTIKSVTKQPFTYKESVDENAYVVEVEWEYTNTSTSNGYQDNATMTFVHEDKKLSLVEIQ